MSDKLVAWICVWVEAAVCVASLAITMTMHPPLWAAIWMVSCSALAAALAVFMANKNRDLWP